MYEIDLGKCEVELRFCEAGLKKCDPCHSRRPNWCVESEAPCLMLIGGSPVMPWGCPVTHNSIVVSQLVVLSTDIKDMHDHDGEQMQWWVTG